MLRPHTASDRRRRCVALTLAALVAASAHSTACSSDGGKAAADAAADARRPTVFGGDRPMVLEVPRAYAADKTWPLVFVLHSYGATGFIQKKLLGYDKLVEAEGILLAAPDGKQNPSGKLFWNATDACCDFSKSGVDDVAYLTTLIDEISAAYRVDDKRIYLIGHSNGGFMSYKMACERADRIAAIISLAGATYDDGAKCKPTSTVSVAQLHGDKDQTIGYSGGLGGTGAPYPGALDSAKTWAGYNGCSTTASVVPPKLDLDSRVAGAETTVERFDGCPSGVDVELWTLAGGSHVPFPTADFAGNTWAFFSAHPKR